MNNIDVKDIEILFIELKDSGFSTNVYRFTNGVEVSISKNGKTNINNESIDDIILTAKDYIEEIYNGRLTKITINHSPIHFEDAVLGLILKNSKFQTLDLFFTIDEEIEMKKNKYVSSFLNFFKKENNENNLIIGNNLSRVTDEIMMIPFNKIVRFFVENEDTYNRLLDDNNLSIIQIGKKKYEKNGFYVRIVRDI